MRVPGPLVTFLLTPRILIVFLDSKRDHAGTLQETVVSDSWAVRSRPPALIWKPFPVEGQQHAGSLTCVCKCVGTWPFVQRLPAAQDGGTAPRR